MEINACRPPGCRAVGARQGGGAQSRHMPSWRIKSSVHAGVDAHEENELDAHAGE